MTNQISKVRRGDDKQKVAAAISEMHDNEQEEIEELIAMDEEVLGEVDAMDWCEWDEYLEPDDIVFEESYDPWMEMDYDYR